jgi:uncharacterized protein (TIGR03083 family)
MMDDKAIPIRTVHLFPKLDRLLINMLRGLEPSDWSSPTSAGDWTVKDIAAHLLDGNLRGLSVSRDGYVGQKPEGIDSYGSLVAFLNRLNHTWTDAAKRISPALLTDLLEITGQQYAHHLESLDPFAEAVFSVAWAGQQVSPNWFHIAREYTEKWHHQQQVRLALGQAEPLFESELYMPFLDTSMQALPHHFRNFPGVEGERILVQVPAYASWQLVYANGRWSFTGDEEGPADSAAVIDPAMAWRLLTKGVPPSEALAYVSVTGRGELQEMLCTMRAVMA